MKHFSQIEILNVYVNLKDVQDNKIQFTKTPFLSGFAKHDTNTFISALL